MAERDATYIDNVPEGSWRAASATIGRVRLDGAVLSASMRADQHVVEVTGECAPGELVVGKQYPCRVDANRMTWEFDGALVGQPTAAALRRGQFWHRVVIESKGELIVRRVR